MKKSVMMITALLLAAAIPALAQTGHWSEPVLVDSINTGNHDFYPSISPDGQTLYFTTGNRIRASRWTGTGWGASYDLGPNINRGQRQVKASVTPDNRTLYFTSWASGGIGTYDIWKSRWDDSCQCWGAATVLPPPINTDHIEWDVQLSHDGRKMYISSDRHFSWGDLDIWCSQWNDSTQGWGEPENLGLTVNSSTRDYGAYPSINGNILYFASWGPHHFEAPRWFGPVDIFVAYKHGSVWDSLDILPAPINTYSWEQSPAISADGLTLYFASTRTGGPGFTDIYVTHYATHIDQGENSPNNNLPDMLIFPNPANDRVIFELPLLQGGEWGDLKLYNILGQEINIMKIDQVGRGVWRGLDYDGNSVPSGIYFARYVDKSRAIKSAFTIAR